MYIFKAVNKVFARYDSNRFLKYGLFYWLYQIEALGTRALFFKYIRKKEATLRKNNDELRTLLYLAWSLVLDHEHSYMTICDFIICFFILLLFAGGIGRHFWLGICNKKKVLRYCKTVKIFFVNFKFIYYLTKYVDSIKMFSIRFI